MKNNLIILLLAALLLGCAGTKNAESIASSPEPTSATAPGGALWGPTLYLNGKEQNVYTEHYSMEEKHTSIPLAAFLGSIGAYCVDSPYNEYQVQCYELLGIRFIVDEKTQVFALEQPYDEAVQALVAKGQSVSKQNLEQVSLFPAKLNDNMIIDGKIAVYWGPGAFADHRAIESALRAAGLDVAIEVDYQKNAIYVEISDLPSDTEGIPADPNCPDLQLKKHEWQGYTCLFPESCRITDASAASIGATDEALLMWDTEALKVVGLIEVRYLRIAESTLAGKTLPEWFFESEWLEEDVQAFEQPYTREIASEMAATYLPDASEKDTICLVKLCTDGDDVLILLAEAWSEDGIAEFESIARRFTALNMQ